MLSNSRSPSVVSIHTRKGRAATVIASAIGLIAASTAAQATDFYLDIVNNTNQVIFQVWTSPVSNGDWSTALRSVFVPHSGGRQRIEFSLQLSVYESEPNRGRSIQAARRSCGELGQR